MKTKVITEIVLALFLAIMLTMPVAAQRIDWQPERARFFGYGWGICDDVETPPETYGDRIYFVFAGRKIGDTWRGRGLWVDRDWDEGVLTAVLRITEGYLTHDPEPMHVTEIFSMDGQAKVFINWVYKGTYSFHLRFGDADASVNPPGTPGEQPDWIGLRLAYLSETYYETGHPRVKGGDIVTWWYPEYSE